MPTRVPSGPPALHCQVVAVGAGRKDEDGKVTPPNVKPGQTVMYSKYSGTEFEVRSGSSVRRRRRRRLPVCAGAAGAVLWSRALLQRGQGEGRDFMLPTTLFVFLAVAQEEEQEFIVVRETDILAALS